MIIDTATSPTRKPPRRRFVQTMLIGAGAAAAITAATAIPAVASTAHHPAGTTVSAAAGPAAYSGFHDAPISLPSTLGTIASLPIPAGGNYVVFAKLTLFNGENVDDTLTCKLIAGGDFDTSTTVLTGNTTPFADFAAMSLNVVNHFSGPGSVKLQCTGNGVTTAASWIKITAIRVGTLSNTPL